MTLHVGRYYRRSALALKMCSRSCQPSSRGDTVDEDAGADKADVFTI